jgi:carboxylesterase
MRSDSFPVFQNPDADGKTFFWRASGNNNVAILLLHGFTATTVEVRSMAKFLNEHGFTVMGPLLPGHGISPEMLNKVRYKDWLESAEKSLKELTKDHNQVFLLGESMGGLLSLWLAAKTPAISGILIFAPALRIRGLWRSRFIWPFVPFTKKKHIDVSSPWQGFNVVPLRAAAQLNHLQGLVRRKLASINQPLLIFQGKLDQTIDPLGSVDVLERTGSEDKELVWLEESPHCVLLGNQFDQVCQLSLDFIRRLTR